MKKKIFLMLSVVSVVVILSLSMMSCFEHHLRPSGVYTTKEHVENGKTYRVLVNFVQENLDDKKGVSGHVQYAKQEKNSDNTWKTLKIEKSETFVYKTINPMTQTKYINTSERLQILGPGTTIFSVSWTTNKFKAESSASLLGIPREEIENDKFDGGKYQGFIFTKSDETFPTEVTQETPTTTP